MSKRRMVLFPKLVLLLLANTGMPPIVLVAGENESEAPSQILSGVGPSEELQQALNWLDRYLSVQVLFNREDIEKIRNNVENMTPEQIRNWIQETKQLRAQLDSDEWQRTRIFLKDFLSKQAIYSDEEIAQFRAEAAEMTPNELSDLLKRIEGKHRELIAGRAGFETERAAQAREIEEYKQQEETRRTATLQMQQDLAKKQAAARSAAARSSRGSHALFGTSQGSTVKPRPYRRPQPLYRGFRWGW